MTKLFQNFNDYDINDWKENIIKEFGNEAFLNLHKKTEGVNISPYITTIAPISMLIFQMKLLTFKK
jgi:hypothetical protein